jgi:hypothetical protein
MKCSTIVKTFPICALVALAMIVAPAARADDKGCSVASLKGTFAYTGTGFNVAANGVAAPFAEVGVQTFDGAGSTTTTFSASANGNLFQISFSGTYTVNSDCTGTMTLLTPAPNPTITLFFTIADNLNEFQAIETLPGVVVTRIGRRMFPGRNM